jgi:hypothetical protein
MNTLKDWSNSKRHEQAVNLFVQMGHFNHLTTSDEVKPLSLTARDLFLLVEKEHDDLSLSQKEELKQSPKLQKSLNQLLHSRSLAYLPTIAAASDGMISERQGDGFTFLFKPSRAKSGQLYVQILSHHGPTPSQLLIITTTVTILKKKLPEPDDGVIQILASEEEDWVKALRDHKAEVYLLP